MNNLHNDSSNKDLHTKSPLKNKSTNRLIKETSPYLLQHAHNPVDWFPWSSEAFDKAKREDKPVLVSIGYSACHWCHVMERESFEDPEVAALMNEHFVNIKVDREERPDLDHIYMDAVQAISGGGGWPLNVFLTPEGKPFYGGTYYPPRRAFNRSSWTEILLALSKTYKEKRAEVETQAETLTEHLRSSAIFEQMNTAAGFSKQKIDNAYKNIMQTADTEWGGFGKAPKFPQTFTINFLLRYAHLTGNEEAKTQALLSLNKMLQGGIYDHIGGGFARYSTDREWLAPHFEKMLYDNALLVSTLAEAYQLTGNDVYKTVVEETLEFIEREMRHPQGGFYSALDADSEGEEGRFYVWDYAETKAILEDDFDLFASYYNITPAGNWEGKNIPRILMPFNFFVQENKLEPEKFQTLLVRSKKKLLIERSRRVRPQLDDKIILGWNALMNIAFVKAYAATGNEHYKEIAIANMGFLLKNFEVEKKDNKLHHTWKNGHGKHVAFLDDYSYLIAANIELCMVSTDHSWLYKAQELTELVLKHFIDDDTSFFYYTPEFQTDILLRKKEVYDGAVPSGNAVMATNLYQLSILLDKPRWKEKADEMLSSLADIIIKYPGSFGVWLALITEINYGTSEIAVIGKNVKVRLKEILKLYIPHKLVMASEVENDLFPLLKDKKTDEETLFFLCENYACHQPVSTIEELQQLMNQNISGYMQ